MLALIYFILDTKTFTINFTSCYFSYVLYVKKKLMQVASNQPVWKLLGEAYVQEWTSYG